MGRFVAPRTSARDQVADQMRDLILTNKWAAGKNLPNENELVRQFGVSRVTLRGAVAMLVNEGLLVVDRPYGTSVKDWLSEGSMHLVAGLLRLHHGNGAGRMILNETLWLRATLYRGLAQLLCSKAPDLSRVERELRELASLFWRADAIPARHVLFQEEEVLCSLASSALNGPTMLLAHSLRRALEVVVRQSTASVDTPSACPRFEALLAAIRAQDQPATEQLFVERCALRKPQYLELVSTPWRGAVEASPNI